MSNQPKSVVETLRAARELIADPKRWTKYASARPSKRSNTSVAPTNPEAGAWCASGALSKIDGPSELKAFRALAHAINGSMRDGEWWVIVDFNDTSGRRHRDVLAAFDRAIKAEEAKEKSVS